MFINIFGPKACCDCCILMRAVCVVGCLQSTVYSPHVTHMTSWNRIWCPGMQPVNISELSPQYIFLVSFLVFNPDLGRNFLSIQGLRFRGVLSVIDRATDTGFFLPSCVSDKSLCNCLNYCSLLLCICACGVKQ